MKKSDYYRHIYLGDYDKSDYNDFIKWGFGEGMYREEFEKYKDDGVDVLFRSEDGGDFYIDIPLQ